MPIPSHNFGAVLFLSELGLQRQLFDLSLGRLERAARHWRDLGQGIDDGHKAPPLEIVADCAVCLSSMAAVRRALFPSRKSTVVVIRRSRALLSLLGDPSLPYMTSVEVRNSWEHLDERLDTLLRNRVPGQMSVSEVHVSATGPGPNIVALRRFDPAEFAIHYAGQRIALRPCAIEMAELSALIDRAYIRLRSERVDV